MKRMRVVPAILSLLILAGCTGPIVTLPTVSQLEIVKEDEGWVQVRTTGIPTTGFRILWGDADTSYGISNVVPGEEHYEHFYQAVFGARSGEQIPTQYAISLIDGDGHIIDQTSTLVALSDCYLELVSLEGRQVTVKYWGRFGIDYSISWGDQFADHVMINMQTATGLLSHTYTSAGIYTLGMEEIWSPRQTFFTITVE